uniref:Uncharacterized protein n=1 Tax=Arundo donax TaxID=35708 RepID=A0A0A9FF54_ARUDO
MNTSSINSWREAMESINNNNNDHAAYICWTEFELLLETPPAIACTPKQCLLYLVGAYYLSLAFLL